MQPTNSSQSEPESRPTSTPAPIKPDPPIAPQPSEQLSTAKIESPQTTVKPVALQTADDTSQFASLKPAKDYWRLIWKIAIGLNFFVGALFLLFVLLKLLSIGGGFQAGAAGTPFWLLPELLIADVALLVAYFIMKRPQLSEITHKLMWLGIGLGAAFLTAIAFVVYVSL